MGKVASGTKWVGSIAATIAVGLQVSPDQASSNAALWIKALTGHMPNWPREVDLWLTIFTIAIALTSAAIWLRGRWRPKLRQKRPDLPMFRDRKFIPFVEIADLAAHYGIALPCSGRAGNNAYYLEGALRQFAVRGTLKVEGRLYRGPLRDNDPLVEIPKEHFTDYGFDHGVLGYNVSNETSRTGGIDVRLQNPNGILGVTYYDIHVSKADVRQVLQDFARSEKNEQPE